MGYLKWKSGPWMLRVYVKIFLHIYSNTFFDRNIRKTIIGESVRILLMQWILSGQIPGFNLLLDEVATMAVEPFGVEFVVPVVVPEKEYCVVEA